jgi:hypothetical protein
MFVVSTNGMVDPFHHIDGNHANRSRSNLRMVCPNCHSQTDTFRVKNVKRRKVPDDVIIQALRECNGEVMKALRQVGLPDCGNSWRRAVRLKEQMPS